MYRNLALIGLMFLVKFSLCQDTPYKNIPYDFIWNDSNVITYYGSSEKDYKYLYKKLNKLILTDQGQIKVLQIGDSHIQADNFSGQMRNNLQSFALGVMGSRGFLFPYNVASTNNPDNYKVKYTGKWHSCRNIQPALSCELGIAGIAVTTLDTNSSIQIILNPRELTHQDYNKVKIFHNMGDSIYKMRVLESNTGKEISGIDNELGYTSFTTNDHYDVLDISFIKTDSLQKSITIYGMEIDNDDPGIIYSAVGVNGAEVVSYLKCNLLEQHLKALAPEWIIISLGTNDAYNITFDNIAFERNLTTLIKRIRTAAPDVAILLTTPADSYRKKRFPNPNMMKAGQAIINVATQNNCAVWDIHKIMGGYMSIKKWISAGLAGGDKVHFTKNGYIVQGDLLFNAFLKSYDNYIDISRKN